MAITSKGAYGSMPQHRQPSETPGWKALFHSVRDIALIYDKTIRPGFGVLRAGTVMTQLYGGTELVPYPTTTRTTITPSRTYVVSDVAAQATTLRVLIADSYRFAVGDTIILCNNSASGVFEDLGAITAIDRTTYPNFAVITPTTAVANVSTHTVANSTNIYHKGAVGTPFIAASYILDKDVDTGEGAGSLGGLTSVVVSNAILNYGSLVNIDAGAITNLSAVNDSNRFLILK
jgi:hypothetical protein